MKITIPLAIALSVITTGAMAQTSQQSSNQVRSGATAAIFSGDGADLSEQVPTVYAPGLTATSDCLGSASGGGAVSGFGLSFGSTHGVEDCERRQWYVMMMRAGNEPVGWAIACQTEYVRKAAAQTPGFTCPEQRTTEEIQQASADGERPPYCDDGGMATEATIRENCPNAAEILE